jgi:hypothetical protein
MKILAMRYSRDDLEETELECTHWIHARNYREQWRALVDTVVKLLAPQNALHFLWLRNSSLHKDTQLSFIDVQFREATISV